MGEKYQKPIARELGELAFATGSCTSGGVANLLSRCVPGIGNAGGCVTTGTLAGSANCASGDDPTQSFPCGPGTNVTDCSNGRYAV